MKKLKLLKTLNTLIVACLVLTLILMYFIPTKLNFSNFWYIIVIVFYSLMLYIKYFLIGSDNVLWFAICLTLLSVYMVLFNLQIIGISTFPLIALIPALTSFIVFLIYKNILHLNLLVIFSFIGLPLFLISYEIVGFWWFLFIEIMSIMLAVVLINVIYYNYKR